MDRRSGANAAERKEGRKGRRWLFRSIKLPLSQNATSGTDPAFTPPIWPSNDTLKSVAKQTSEKDTHRPRERRAKHGGGREAAGSEHTTRSW
ncbi:hypothetical protein ZHAS_00015171 [Anopheles sinensis]|uniref:Uncharacterized protein n=1 Tax=Anopheles sinensis TaxID=74873 RepID=A0A084WA78_ANOSI|nr:hypothetical protein ZHAS_00015171 [Anopheles sinensis]